MYLPTCPNHGCEMNETGDRANWICPISGALFQVAADTAESEIAYDITGNVVPSWKVEQIDGEGG